jgi:hypothetical protein
VNPVSWSTKPALAGTVWLPGAWWSDATTMRLATHQPPQPATACSRGRGLAVAVWNSRCGPEGLAPLGEVAPPEESRVRRAGAWCWRQGEGAVGESRDVWGRSRSRAKKGSGRWVGAKDADSRLTDARRGRLQEEVTGGGGWSEGEPGESRRWGLEGDAWESVAGAGDSCFVLLVVCVCVSR